MERVGREAGADCRPGRCLTGAHLTEVFEVRPF